METDAGKRNAENAEIRRGSQRRENKFPEEKGRGSQKWKGFD